MKAKLKTTIPASLRTRLNRQAKALLARTRNTPLCVQSNTPLPKYPDPVEYASKVLHIETLWDVQKQILASLLVPPYRTLVASGHDVGKTFTAALALNWWYDTFDPGVIISTAPSSREVRQLLWTEVRLQRQRAFQLGSNLSMDFCGASSPEMKSSPEHWAQGYTSEKGEGYVGRHRMRMLFIIDEANGVGHEVWEGFNTMFDPSLGCAMLAIFNPTSTTSHAYQEDIRAEDEDGKPNWHRFRLSALEHPNITEELAGRPKLIPGAVSIQMIDQWVKDWCEPVLGE
jgi:hypothetical protein